MGKGLLSEETGSLRPNTGRAVSGLGSGMSTVRPEESLSGGHVRVEYLPLSTLKPARRNPKRHSVVTVAKSMARFGYVAPMVLDERTGRLVAGHGRLESLKKAKAEDKQPPGRIRVQNGD